MDSTPKTILITGCSTGIGHDAALALKQRGHQVIASCRKETDRLKLQALGLDTVLIDINDSVSIKEGFAEFLEKTSGHIDVLINNAGYGQMGALEDVPRHSLREQFETNVFGLMELSQQVIPLMRAQKSGRIINISSVLGIISMPFRGAYNASKYAVEGLSDTLRLELKPSGIDVICVEPGPIVSEFRNNSIERSLSKLDTENSFFKEHYHKMVGNFKTAKNNAPFTKTTAAVIDKLIHAIESKHPKPNYPVTLPAHFFSILKRLVSKKTLNKFLAYISKKELK